MKKRTIKKVRAIIYDIKNGRPYFLILHRILRWRGWEFLKETIERGEILRKAVLRGIREETKLKKFRIIKRLDKQEKWQALGRNYFIVNTFLVKANMNEKISLKQEIVEHNRYQWVDKKTALKRLTWPKTRKIFKNINDELFI